MSIEYYSPLLTLPVEILHHIIDHLDTSTIFLSLSNVCTHLRAICSSYHRYQLDFSSTAKADFHRISQLIQPENVRSLTLSDDNKTPGQIKLFLSLFHFDQFTRLFSLNLIGIDDKDLSEIAQFVTAPTLTSLLINWREAHCPSTETMSFLSSILSQLQLRKLELKTSSYTIENMSWPVQYKLEHLTLMYITQKQYCTILRTTPNLKTLVLNHCSMHIVEEDVETVFDQLISLTLTDSRMSIVGLLSILSLTPSLVHLQIIGLPDPFDTMADGYRWEKFIRVNLPVLQKFEFFFTNIYNVYYQPRDVHLLISRFQTPFWVEDKRWYVTCDYITYLNQVMLYTIPLCSTDFTYECETNKVSYSTFFTPINNNMMVTENVRSINLTLTKLMAGVVLAKVS